MLDPGSGSGTSAVLLWMYFAPATRSVIFVSSVNGEPLVSAAPASASPALTSMTLPFSGETVTLVKTSKASLPPVAVTSPPEIETPPLKE